mmetsp:Transcript_82376/g.191309  ORF Transcript_82376/g.191309 Transcript_82376/m.191309 type:complete len:107 (-) Transcript_82376:183-503(-)
MAWADLVVMGCALTTGMARLEALLDATDAIRRLRPVAELEGLVGRTAVTLLEGGSGDVGRTADTGNRTEVPGRGNGCVCGGCNAGCVAGCAVGCAAGCSAAGMAPR